MLILKTQIIKTQPSTFLSLRFQKREINYHHHKIEIPTYRDKSESPLTLYFSLFGDPDRKFPLTRALPVYRELVLRGSLRCALPVYCELVLRGSLGEGQPLA